MTERAAARWAQRLMDRWELRYEHLLGVRFAVNVFIATAIVWYGLTAIGDTKPIWGIASMVAASDPEVSEARRMFFARLINVLVGCAVGLAFLLFGGTRAWELPFALAVTVLLSSYVVQVKTMWRQAPISAAVVIASGIAMGAAKPGIREGLHKVLEVIIGCLVGLIVSWAMSKVWLIKKPAAGAQG
jgi:uncharacterized membrane protein YccC